jgi:maleamate amidohydrolase
LVHPKDTDYRSAGFAGTVGFGRRPALIVIDLMMSYFERTSPMYAAVEGVLPSNLRLIDAAHAAAIPVFFTKQYYEDTRDESVYVRKVPALKLLRPGSPFAELHPALPLAKGTTFVKHFPSAFHRTDFGERLAALDVDTLIMTGLTTSGCVRATAMDALLHDLAGVVVREAVGDRDPAIHEANLFDIHGKLADVRGEGEVLAWIASRR